PVSSAQRSFSSMSAKRGNAECAEPAEHLLTEKHSALSAVSFPLRDPRDVVVNYRENVPKNEERRFGSDHFDPSPDPVNECCAVRPIPASSTVASGWNHCMAPQVSSCGECLETSSFTAAVLTCTSASPSANAIGAGATLTIVPSVPFESSLAMATSASCWARFAR